MFSLGCGTSLPGMPPDEASTRVIPFYSLTLGDLVVPRGVLVIRCRACSRVSRVPVVSVLSRFGYRYGVRDLERVHVCPGCKAKAHGWLNIEWL